jgi:cytochrome b561
MAYSRAAGMLHWLAAFPMIGCIASVLQAQNAPKEQKGDLMFRHKSLGLLTGLIVAPRFAYRLFSRSAYKVQELPGNAAWENVAGSVSHYALYAFMTVMPATGIAMGYYGGKGLPFFFTTLSGATEANGEIAKRSFQIHKQLGTYGKFLVPLHVGASTWHYFRGQSIFTRINPFRAARG